MANPRTLVVLAALAFALAGCARHLPPAGTTSCETAGQYRSAKGLLDRARAESAAGRYPQALAQAEQGIAVLGSAYESPNLPAALDDTGLKLSGAAYMKRQNDFQGAALETSSMLESRLHSYVFTFGDPAKECPPRP